MYWLWVFLVFMYYAITYIIRFLNLHNRVIEFENFKKIWKHYNFIKDEYYFLPSDKNRHNEEKNFLDKSRMYFTEHELKRKRIWSNILQLVCQFIIFPLLSRISVLFIIYALIGSKLKEKGLPKEIKEKIKESQFKLKYNKLNKRQVRMLGIKLAKLLWVECEEEFIGDFGAFTIKYLQNIISTRYRDEEYRIKWTDIQTRVINARWFEKNEMIYYIKDWVVTNEYPKDFHWTKEERKETTKRKPLMNAKQYAYILYFDENLSDDNLKDYFRQNINNVDSCRKELKNFFSKHNVTFNTWENEDKYYIHSRWENKENFDKEMERIAEKYSCKTYYLKEFNKIWEVKVIGKYKVWTDKEWHDDPKRIPCIKDNWDSFEPSILSFYRWLLEDI